VGLEGKVVGIDHIPQLVEMSRKNAQKDAPELLESKQLVLEVADGRNGYPAEAPYNAIHVGAAAHVVPEALLQQLASPGRLIIPVGPEHGHQELIQYDKDENGHIKKTPLFGVIYVPLTSPEAQTSRWR